MKQALAILAKAPIAGQVKTRLIGALCAEEVAVLYRSFLVDTVARALKLDECQVFLAHTAAEGRDLLRDLTGGSVRLLAQGAGGLGVRMAEVYKQVFDEACSAVVIIGADLPTLPLRYLRQAFASLDSAQVVLGPSLDGGYYLLGLNSPQPDLLRHITWSTDEVLSQTVDRIRRLGLSVRCLDPWYDVDTVEDLHYLIAHLRLLVACGDPDVPRDTVSTLMELGLLSAV